MMTSRGVFLWASVLVAGWLSACDLASAAGGRGPATLKVCMLSGSEEYESDRTLAAFVKRLEAENGAKCRLLKAVGTTDLPGLEALGECDVALVFTRRLTLPEDQLAKIRDYVESGRPVVAVRTASHGLQNWLDFDARVLGGGYHGHHGNAFSQRARVVKEAASHPVMSGVGMIASRGSLYKTGPVAADATILMMSDSPEATEAATWVRERDGQRVFYTELGAQGDFENAAFVRMLTNALYWAAGREVPEPPGAVRPALRPKPEGAMTLKLRKMVEKPAGSGDWHELHGEQVVPAAEVGVVICDMWDLHWCRGATERCDAIARKMNGVVKELRARGVQIVHAPSETMNFYSWSPQRLRAQMAPRVKKPPPHVLPAEPPLPIDDSDGGCDTDDTMYQAWTRQHPAIAIGEYDAISDNGDEIYGLFREMGIKYVIVMGVHTNMCVLNRTFAIKEMTRRGLSCVLVRDLTDTMYDPKDRPYVPHDEGTSLVVEHIEKYWCPSTTSAELMSGVP